MSNYQYNDMEEITPNLYLGNKASSKDIKKLKDLNIKKLLSLIDFSSPSY